MHPIKRIKITHKMSDKTGKHTFIIKLNGLTVLGCCRQITLINYTCNVHLVPMFRSWSSDQQSEGKIPQSGYTEFLKLTQHLMK